MNASVAGMANDFMAGAFYGPSFMLCHPSGGLRPTLQRWPKASIPAATAAAQLRKANMSCIAGHQQGRQVAYASKATGETITSIIAGSCYEHDEDYLGVQGNKHWRGIIMLNEVNNGSFDESFVSLKFLEKYK
jgi:hypothetical protein